MKKFKNKRELSLVSTSAWSLYTPISLLGLVNYIRHFTYIYPTPYTFYSLPLHSSWNVNIYKLIVPVAKRFILNFIWDYLLKLCTFLVNKYPFLYKSMHYFLAILPILVIFFVYIYTRILRLITIFKDRFPIFYNITYYIYCEYWAMIQGDLSKNMWIIISLLVLYDQSNTFILLYIFLLVNTWCRQFLMTNDLSKNYPYLYKLAFVTSSLINTILISYFLDAIIVMIKPFISKIWNGILKMYDPVRDCNIPTGSGQPTGNPNPRPPKRPLDSVNVTEKKKKTYKEKEDDYKWKKPVEIRGRHTSWRQTRDFMSKAEQLVHLEADLDYQKDAILTEKNNKDAIRAINNRIRHIQREMIKVRNS